MSHLSILHHASRAVEQHVDQCGHIGNGHLAFTGHVGISQIDSTAITVQQVIDQGSHVGNGHMTVIVDIARLARAAGIGSPACAVPSPMIDIPIFSIGLADLGCSDDIPLNGIVFGIIIDNGIKLSGSIGAACGLRVDDMTHLAGIECIIE